MNFQLTDHNPEHDEIKEKGYAFIQAPKFGDAYGAPYVDEDYEPTDDEQTRIIFW